MGEGGGCQVEYALRVHDVAVCTAMRPTWEALTSLAADSTGADSADIWICDGQNNLVLIDLGHPDARPKNTLTPPLDHGAPIRLKDGSVTGYLTVNLPSQGALSTLQREKLTQIASIASRSISDRFVATRIEETESRFANLFENALSGCIILSPHADDEGRLVDMRIEHVNETACHILGLERSIWEGQLHKDVFPVSRTNGVVESYIEVYESGKPWRQEINYVDARVSGWYEISAVRISGGIAVTFLDVTERVESAQQLSEQNRMLRLFLEHTPASVAMYDNELRFMAASRHWLRVYGFENENIVGVNHQTLFPNIPERWRELQQRSLAGASYSIEADEIETVGGATAWISWAMHPWYNDDGSVGGIVTFTNDVTERRQIEIDLQESREHLDLALESANIGLWDWDIADGRIRFNKHLWAMLGHDARNPPEFPPGHDAWCSLVHEQDENTVKSAMRLHLEGKRRNYTAEYRMRCADGNYRWFRSVGRVIEHDNNGKPARVLGVDIDIHEQQINNESIERFAKDVEEARSILEKQADELTQSNEQLEDAREQAVQASQAKTEFLANMSHEIRTPMTAILGYAELLCDSSTNHHQRTEHANTIIRNGNHLLDIINDILDLSRVESGRMTIERINCSPMEVVSGVTDLLGPKANGKGIELRVEAVGALPELVQSDPTRLRQILLNLVGNAIKFTEHGSVTIRVEYDPGHPDGSRLHFDVIDTGIGIPADRIDTLFEAFTQTDSSHTRRFGGTGLGLTISAKLAALLGGNASLVKSIQGIGSTFRLSIDPGAVLGVEENSRDVCLTVQNVDRPIPKLTGRILLAEDGIDNQRLISYLLGQAGAEVSVVENGRDVIESATQALAADTPFDLIFMDMQMPEVDGLTATKTLRSAGYTLPIVALTAHALPAERKRCLEHGCDDHLPKPIDRRRLIEAAHYWISQAPAGSA